MLKVMDNQEQLISKLIKGSSGIRAISYSCREICTEKNEETEVYYRRVDSEIKSAIKNRLNPKNTEPVNYDRLNSKHNYMFFFLAEVGCTSDKLLDDIKRYNFDLEKVVQTLLSLRLKLAYINDVTAHYDIEPALYNTKLYVGAVEIKKLKDGGSLIEALSLNLYFSKQHEIALSLHKQAFSCEDVFMPESKDSCLLFHHKSKTLRVKDTLDAVKWSKRPYMAYSLKKEAKIFDKYENCINYHLTVSLNKLVTLLSDAGIDFSPIEFKADYIVSQFIESNEQYNNQLVIIDNFSRYETEESRIQFREYLKQTFGAKCVIGVEDAPKPEELKTEGVSYLVINEEQKKNGSSIIRIDTGKPLNGFFQALGLYLKDARIPFDYYTSVKIHRFLKNLPSVTQGLDIERVTKQEIHIDSDGNKLPATTVLNELDKNKVKKIKTELWLKEQVFHHCAIKGINFPCSELVLFFARKLKKPEKQTYVAVVDVTANEDGLKINSHKRYETNDKSRFDFTYPYLRRIFQNGDSCFDALYNQGFYIYDKTHKKLLVSYSSDSVPNLIGNAAFDNVERSKIADGINRQRSPEVCVLPYYINPTLKRKQLHHIFLEDCGQEGFRYFVSKAGQPAAKIEKQSKTQNILIFNDLANKVHPPKDELTTLFLQSFTFDILNNSEVSKKSIFQKIAEMYIEN
jgi:hypothetical protein